MAARDKAKRDDYSPERILSVGNMWLACDRRFTPYSSAAGRVFKGFSVRGNYNGDDAYTSRYQVVLRVQINGDDFVKIRRFNSLLGLPFVLHDMWASDVGWREDRYARWA